MSIINMSQLFEMLLWAFMYLILGLMGNILLIFIMHILMPRKVLETYFKEPHFSPTEITMFTGFPLGYMRTAMFMRILGFPDSGKRRKVEDAYKLAPVWYCKASKYIVISVLTTLLLLILVGGTCGLYIVVFE